MSNLIDRYLLFRIRTKRDPEAFAKIYDIYVKAIYRFTLLKLPSKEEAQDITAETFTKTWNYLQEYNEVANIRALLYQIARNLIADFYRSQKYKETIARNVTIQADDTSTILESAEESDHGRDRELIQARAEMSLILQQLEKLKDDYRDVVTLRLVDGLAFTDIAEILGKSKGNVRVIYHRAIKTLKDIK
ncbi:MAG: sigma-70 family RNA polymerase sigma factor [Patescibacteria group bacterium]|nr:sigma-70 family RNA polymerase sigma factor [Patescibacteria group bacterium]